MANIASIRSSRQRKILITTPQDKERYNKPSLFEFKNKRPILLVTDNSYESSLQKDENSTK